MNSACELRRAAVGFAGQVLIPRLHKGEQVGGGFTANAAHAATAGPPCGGPVQLPRICAGFGSRFLGVARYRRHNTVGTAAAGIAAGRPDLEGKATGSGVGASVRKIACQIGTIGMGARQVRRGQRCPAKSAVQRR